MGDNASEGRPQHRQEAGRPAPHPESDGLLSDYRLYTARWNLADLPARRRPPTPAPDPDWQPPTDPGESAAPRPPGQDAREWEIPRIPLQYERAVLASAMVREQLRTTTATAVRGRAYDVVAHHQAAMPEQLLAPEPADPEHDDQEQEPGRREVLDLTAVRARIDWKYALGLELTDAGFDYSVLSEFRVRRGCRGCRCVARSREGCRGGAQVRTARWRVRAAPAAGV